MTNLDWNTNNVTELQVMNLAFSIDNSDPRVRTKVENILASNSLIKLKKRNALRKMLTKYQLLPSFYTQNNTLRKSLDFNVMNAITLNNVNLNTAVVLIGKDPKNPVAPRLYSENSIKTWLKNKPTDPISRAPVRGYIPIPDELKQAFIKKRLL